MVSIPSLWLPILLSAVVVFVASSVMHMVLTYHRNDYGKLPNEDKLREAIRNENVAPGMYVIPCPTDPKEMGSPEMIEKYKEGPVGMMSVFPNGPPVMPKFLGAWFAYSLAVGIVLAYVAGRTLAPGADYLAVFRIVGTVGLVAYAGSEPVNSIWRGQSWSVTVKNIFDGLVYALLTAGMFGWLWPG